MRDQAEHKVWSQLGRLAIIKRDERPDLVIGIIGCMAEREVKEIQRRAPQVELICGPSMLDRLPEMLQSTINQRSVQVAISGHTSRRSAVLEAATDGVEALDLSRSFSPTRTGAQAYVRITRGCDKFCSFCVVAVYRAGRRRTVRRRLLSTKSASWSTPASSK